MELPDIIAMSVMNKQKKSKFFERNLRVEHDGRGQAPGKGFPGTQGNITPDST